MTIPHILVVDDEADIRGLLKEILSEEGYEVDVAANAVQARASRARQTPDLVLLDLTLPDGDGLGIVSELLVEADPPTFVALTGHDSREVADRCMAAGCISVVVKPVSSKELLATVDPLLARRT